MTESTSVGQSAPTICPVLLYRDAKAAISTLTEAFGFTADAVYEDEDGQVLHAELSFGNGAVMVGSRGGEGAFAEAMRDAGTTAVFVTVPDADAHHDRARSHGVEIIAPPTDQDYGSRDYIARDPEGNVWSFGTYTVKQGG
ncbi:VOC family protein [Streptomyces alkaliterrae]|uniref:VOC family protein n=1 Tax=Streptomyces alkaliterrae TaxID=2213162 RepID=A0A5P0YJC3_9ACTN|nr:VOC family protein [Streptomyces alkaliterrae]MBB1252051.1 VOC family protein [Streptomyces alkaliterrae]MBB1259852.1 VOC family protein [Streptomyces alkaliterrae]MQS00415.1 hypothetical protein [Streptomyces alkaliterrae]